MARTAQVPYTLHQSVGSFSGAQWDVPHTPLQIPEHSGLFLMPLCKFWSTVGGSTYPLANSGAGLANSGAGLANSGAGLANSGAH